MLTALAVTNQTIAADPGPALHDTLIDELLTRRVEVATVVEWARALEVSS